MSEKIALQKKYVLSQNSTQPIEGQYLTYDALGNQIAKTFETNFYPVLHVNTNENCNVIITNGNFSLESSKNEAKLFVPTDSDGVRFTLYNQSYSHTITELTNQFIIYRDNNYDTAVIDDNGKLVDGSVKIDNGEVGYTASYVFIGNQQRTLITLDYAVSNTSVLVAYNQLIGPLYVSGSSEDNDFAIPELSEWNVSIYNENKKIKEKSINIDTINYYSIDIYPYDCEFFIKAPPGCTVICQKNEIVYYTDSFISNRRIDSSTVYGYSIHVYEEGTWNITVKSNYESVSTSITLSDEDDETTKILNTSLHVVPVVPLNDNTWEVISWASYTGNNPGWEVGDFKVVTIPTGKFQGTYKATIIGFNHNQNYEGQNTIHFQLFKVSDQTNVTYQDIINRPEDFNNRHVEEHEVNSSYFLYNLVVIGGYSNDTDSYEWEKTDLYNRISNTNVYNLPEDLWNSIRPAIKYTTRIVTNATGNYNNYPVKTETKLFLLSPIEVGISTVNSNIKDIWQSTYTYYSDSSTATERRKLLTSSSSIVENLGWWLRRATAKHVTTGWGITQWEYLYINSDGTSGGTDFIGPSGNYLNPNFVKKGISPCFVI